MPVPDRIRPGTTLGAVAYPADYTDGTCSGYLGDVIPRKRALTELHRVDTVAYFPMLQNATFPK